VAAALGAGWAGIELSAPLRRERGCPRGLLPANHARVILGAAVRIPAELIGPGPAVR
jgi:hypothetical protein